MYAGEYLDENIGHEIINTFKTDNGEHYIYVNPWGLINEEYSESKNIILEPENYLKLVRGEKVQKAYSLSEVKATAVNIHDSLRINKMTEKGKEDQR